MSPIAAFIPPESELVEWKQSLGEWKEIVETCAAFATARSGTIYVGVASNGTPGRTTGTFLSYLSNLDETS